MSLTALTLGDGTISSIGVSELTSSTYYQNNLTCVDFRRNKDIAKEGYDLLASRIVHLEELDGCAPQEYQVHGAGQFFMEKRLLMDG